MGNFRDNRESRGRGFGRDRGGFRDRGFRGRGGERGGFRERRRSFVKHEVTCDKCGKMTDVPFEPRTGKPIYCRECFDSGNNLSNNSSPASGSGMSSEQFQQLNTKLDKILEILESIEFEEVEEES